MSLHTDLLEQAGHLAKRERKRPRQASLRRAVSAAYYALFHLLVREATELLLSGNMRKPLRQRVARVFSHREMIAASRSLSRFHHGTPPGKLLAILDGLTPQPELINVAGTLVELQDARHDADYNTSRSFTRSEAGDLIDQTARAFDDWARVRRSPEAEVYLVSLLTWERLRD